MVHTFRCLDRDFMLDTESGSFYQIDELTKKLIDLKNSSDETMAEEFSCYKKEDILNAQAEIDELINEGVLFKKEPPHNLGSFNPIIKSMCLNISHKCNLKCGYCFADGGAYYGEALNMPFEVSKKAINFLIENSGNRKNLEVDFFGGEPILNIDVVKKTVEYARERESTIGKKFRFTITTNALALTDDIIDFFNREMFNVVISIDGRKSVHNFVRKTLNDGDSFDIVFKNALKFKEKRGDKQYYIRGTFTSKNKDFSSDALALNDFGFDSISLEPVVLPPKHPLEITLNDVPILCNEYEKLATEYINRRKNGKAFSFFHFNVDLDGGACEAKRLKSCGAGCEYVAVIPNGDIFPCHQFAGNSRFKMGNVTEGAFDKLISKAFVNNSILSKEHCKKCWAKYFCSGGCAANSVNLMGSMLSMHEVSCLLMKKRIECALAILCIEQNP